MEFRKIISFGKSSFVVSLPKDWMQANKLKKGDVLFVEQAANNLILVPNEPHQEKEIRRTVVHVDNKTLKRIKREVYSAFINYNDYIELEGKDIPKIRKDITELMHKLMALEIIEQDSSKIVARDFLKVRDINFKDYLKKFDIIIRSMMTDINDIDFNDYEELSERQDNVKRIYLLLLKMFKAVFMDTSLFNKIDIEPADLVKFYRFNIALYNISRDMRDIAENMQQLTKKDKLRVIEHVKILQKHYLKVIKAYYSEDLDLAYDLAIVRDKIKSELEIIRFDADRNISIVGQNIQNIYYELHEVLHRIYS